MDDRRFSLTRLWALFLRLFGAVPRSTIAQALENGERVTAALAHDLKRSKDFAAHVRGQLQEYYDREEVVKADKERAEAMFKAAASVEAQNVALTGQLQAIADVIASDFSDRAIHGEDVHDAAIRIMRDLFRERADFEAVATANDHIQDPND